MRHVSRLLRDLLYIPSLACDVDKSMDVFSLFLPILLTCPEALLRDR